MQGYLAQLIALSTYYARFSKSGFAMFTVFFFARLSLRPGFEDLAGLFGLFQRITVTLGWAWLSLLGVYTLKAPLETPNAAGNRA
jgi:hypothetical protein